MPAHLQIPDIRRSEKRSGEIRDNWERLLRAVPNLVNLVDNVMDHPKGNKGHHNSHKMQSKQPIYIHTYRQTQRP